MWDPSLDRVHSNNATTSQKVSRSFAVLFINKHKDVRSSTQNSGQLRISPNATSETPEVFGDSSRFACQRSVAIYTKNYTSCHSTLPIHYTVPPLTVMQLRQLAGLNRNPSTPARKATNAPSLPTLPSAKRGVRPLGESNNAANTSRPLPPPNTKPATPHGIRALQRRNAALTPGRDRRRSGRIQRETPVNILRNLSRGVFCLPRAALSSNPPNSACSNLQTD